MVNKPRIKGTGWESELVPRIRLFFPTCERAPLKGIQDKGDFVGVPLLMEAKCTGLPKFLEWSRVCARKSKDWVILWHGDRRTYSGELAVMPLNFALELLGRYYGEGTLRTDVPVPEVRVLRDGE